jgi:hypothetical protein
MSSAVRFSENEFMENVSSPEASQFEKLVCSIETQLAIKDEQLRKNSELLERYTVLLEEKNQRIEKLLNRIIEISDRVVDYPMNKHQTPMLLLAREINSIRAVTGQKVHVTKKKRELMPSADIIIESIRPNPQVDFNNIVNKVQNSYADKIQRRNKRNLVFETEDDAIEVASMCKSLLSSSPILAVKRKTT